MFDFPNSPLAGDVAVAPNGVQYRWDGVKWVSLSTPLNVASAYNDVGRNLIHNPLFNIQQRGAGPWTTSGYTLDRWFAGIVTDTATLQSSTLSDGARSQIGDEAAAYSLQCGFTGTASGATYVDHRVENVRRTAGKTVTLSFWALCSSGTPKLGFNLYQSFGTGGSPSAAAWVQTTGAAVTLSTTWTRYSATFIPPSVAGKTFGTNNDSFLDVRIYYSCGASSDVAASGNIGVQSNTVAIWGVQLEVSPYATQLEKPDPQQDLAKCQRFYQQGSVSIRGYAAAGGYMTNMYSYPVRMRAVPTVAWVSPSGANYTSILAPGGLSDVLTFAVQVTAAGDCWVNAGFTASADL